MSAVADRRAALADEVRAASQGRELLVDPVGVAHLQRLMTTAEGLPPASRDALFDRVESTLTRLRSRVRAHDERARAEIDATSAAGVDASAARTAFSAGDTSSAIRAARRDRVRARPTSSASEGARARAGKLARSLGVDPAEHADSLFELVASAYGINAARADAELVVDRADRNAPTNPGRYHTSAVVKRLLVDLGRLSPQYLEALVQKLSMLAEVLAFAEAFEAPKPATVVDLGARRKGGSSNPRRAKTATDGPRPRAGKGRASPQRRAPSKASPKSAPKAAPKARSKG